MAEWVTSYACVIAVILVLQSHITSGFWPGECDRDPGPFALPDNVELDCALRALTVKKSVCALGVTMLPTGQKQRRMDLILEALNMQICDNTSSGLALKALDWGGVSCKNKQITSNTTSFNIYMASLIPQELDQVEYIVCSTNGTDLPTTTGSISNPFATIVFAMQYVRSQRARSVITPTTPVVLRLRSGVYFEALTMTPQDSFVTIASYKDEKTILSGGHLIHGNSWQRTSVGSHAHTVVSLMLLRAIP